MTLSSGLFLANELFIQSKISHKRPGVNCQDWIKPTFPVVSLVKVPRTAPVCGTY